MSGLTRHMRRLRDLALDTPAVDAATEEVAILPTHRPSVFAMLGEEESSSESDASSSSSSTTSSSSSASGAPSAPPPAPRAPRPPKRVPAPRAPPRVVAVPDATTPLLTPLESALLLDVAACNADEEARRVAVGRPHPHPIRRRRCRLVTPDPSWIEPPTLLGGGYGQVLVPGILSTPPVYELHVSPELRALDETFSIVAQTGDPDSLFALHQEAPHHIPTLLALADYHRFLDEGDRAVSLERRALFVLESALHPRFEPWLGAVHVPPPSFSSHSPIGAPSTRPENILFTVLYRAVKNSASRSPRACVEVCKLLLSLCASDPARVLLSLDGPALRSKQFGWFVGLTGSGVNLLLHGTRVPAVQALPGLALHRALSLWHLGGPDAVRWEGGGGSGGVGGGGSLTADTTLFRFSASRLLLRILLLAPGLLLPLLSAPSLALTRDVVGGGALGALDAAALKGVSWQQVWDAPLFSTTAATTPLLTSLIERGVLPFVAVWSGASLRWLHATALIAIELSVLAAALDAGTAQVESAVLSPAAASVLQGGALEAWGEVNTTAELREELFGPAATDDVRAALSHYVRGDTRAPAVVRAPRPAAVDGDWGGEVAPPRLDLLAHHPVRVFFETMLPWTVL